MKLFHLLSSSVTLSAHVALSDEFKPPSHYQLSDDAQRSLLVPNAGGQSEVSEAVSIDYFVRCLGAKDILLEKEIEYWIDYKMVDFVCTIAGNRTGVSVTRAMGFPNADCFTENDATRLIVKKLTGLIISRAGVCDKHAFFKSVLHIWCQTSRIAELVMKAYAAFDARDHDLDVKGAVIVLASVCGSPAVYSNSVL